MTPSSPSPNGQAPEASPPAAPAPRELQPEDFALLARVPARKPETFDRDAISRAAWMVGGLALGLWIISLFAKPNAPIEPIPEPSSVVQEAAPIVLPDHDAVPSAISLTPEPAWTPPPPAQKPGGQDPSLLEQRPGRIPASSGASAPESDEVALPAAADTPDPSNLFQTP